MSVRGSKNKIILYIAGAFSIVFVILLYQNASERLDAMEKSYERCHLNEESLSAQLQVNLEYKVRLEKSLQQEKSDHARLKEDLQTKLDEERQTRERENLESVNKFTALQQQYKFLQSQQEDLNAECGKLRQSHLTEVEDKSRLENLIERLKDELKLVKENKQKEIEELKAKYDELKKENTVLREGKGDFSKNSSHVKLPDTLPLGASILMKGEGSPRADAAPKIDAPSSLKSSTAARKPEQELFPSGNNIYVNTSTPMINPDAVNSQDKISSAGPVAQLQRDDPGFHADEAKENVGAKPEGNKDLNPSLNEAPIPQGVLRAPDIVQDFDHVPAIQLYKQKMLRQDGEKKVEVVGNEGESVGRNDHVHGLRPQWRGGKVANEVFIGHHPAGNEIPKNPVYNYQGDYDNRKEEGEDDDDVDALEYHNEKNQQQLQQQQQLPPLDVLHQMQPLPIQRQQPEHLRFESRHDQSLENRIDNGINFKSPFQDNGDSVMIQPK